MAVGIGDLGLARKRSAHGAQPRELVRPVAPQPRSPRAHRRKQMSDEFDDVPEPPGAGATASLRGRRAAPAIPELIADVYAHAAAGFRARLIECLLRPVGPLALVTIAAGTFGACVHLSRP